MVVDYHNKSNSNSFAVPAHHYYYFITLIIWAQPVNILHCIARAKCQLVPYVM